jgi:two-component system, NtrC family, response regulator AtoC
MPFEKIIIISTDIKTVKTLQKHLKNPYVETNPLQAIALLKKKPFDLILCDLELSKISGMDVLQISKELRKEALFILLTPEAKKGLAAVRLGAFDYLLKPLSSFSIENCLQKGKEHATLLQENALLRQEVSSPPHQERLPLIAESPQMKKLLSDVAKIAQSNASVFIVGESGTGKEVLASAIHHLSFRAGKPFIRVNCSAIPETLLESEFFGHERGAFTGAEKKRMGRFELANTGTLLLDEISEVPLDLQPKLLRVIQEQEFERVGGTSPVKVDVRLISTSNCNMQEAVKKKRFREDLYFRLHVVPLHIPPLRERKADIIPLAKYFLQKLCKENHTPLKHLSNDAQELLLAYSFPGNVRELANIIERTIVMHSGKEIQRRDLKLEFSCPIPVKEESYESSTLEDLEKRHILQTLKILGNNKTKTAKSLGISLRTLHNKLKAYEQTF